MNIKSHPTGNSHHDTIKEQVQIERNTGYEQILLASNITKDENKIVIIGDEANDHMPTHTTEAKNGKNTTNTISTIKGTRIPQNHILRETANSHHH